MFANVSVSAQGLITGFYDISEFICRDCSSQCQTNIPIAVVGAALISVLACGKVNLKFVSPLSSPLSLSASVCLSVCLSIFVSIYLSPFSIFPDSKQAKPQLPSAGLFQRSESGRRQLANFQLQHLLPIRLLASLPSDYPSNRAPLFKLSCLWLSTAQLQSLAKQLMAEWDSKSVACCDVIFG